MRLHEDADAFRTLLLDVSEKQNIRADILEKDYYVVLMLRELAEMQKTLPAYFKGGTALYKALHCIRRFSEDIDITVCIDDCATENARKKRVKDAARNYTSLPPLDDPGNRTGNRSVTRVYAYDSLFQEAEDPLQRFGRVKIEATSFTKSEPHDHMEIAPALYDLADDEQKMILRETFATDPFRIAAIRPERMFMDKIFAAEYYYSIPSERKYTEAAKHLYDLTVMTAMPEIISLLGNEKECAYLASLNREEERVRHNSDLRDKRFSEFTVFNDFHRNADFMRAFAAMQNVYVPDPNDMIPAGRLRNSTERLRSVIAKWDF